MTTTSFHVRTSPLREFGNEFQQKVTADLKSTNGYIDKNADMSKGDGGIVFGPVWDAIDLVRGVAKGYVSGLSTIADPIGTNLIASADDYDKQDAANTEASQQIVTAAEE